MSYCDRSVVVPVTSTGVILKAGEIHPDIKVPGVSERHACRIVIITGISHFLLGRVNTGIVVVISFDIYFVDLLPAIFK